jgi:hypothetical protein
MKKMIEKSTSDASKKFEIYTMDCGKISDFHDGLSQRVGEVPSLFPSANDSIFGESIACI